MSTLERALVIAAEAHAGKLDKAGAPFILHPLRVMLQLTGPKERIAAVLHDVVEDSPEWTLERLRAEGFDEDVLAAVASVTRREGEDYFEYVRRAASHPLGRRIKLADLQDNLDRTRIARPTQPDEARLARYAEALRIVRATDTPR